MNISFFIEKEIKMSNLSKETRGKILNVTGGKCFYCGKNIDISSFHVDHYFSKASGASYKNNRVPACDLIKKSENL